MILQGKNAIITGARRGIGRSTVEVFAQNGANIWAWAKEQNSVFEEELSVISQKYGVEIWPIYADLIDAEQIKHAVLEIKKSKKDIDILANVAGVAADSSSFFMNPIEEMKQVFEVNFWGQTLITQYVARLMMRNNKGSIINISSVAGIDGSPAQFEYVTSKAAVNGSVRYLAQELSQYNIRVNAVAPGIIETDMGAKVESKLKDRTISNTMLKRCGSPEEIANVIAFLGSDLSSYMTGQIIRVDGGM